MMIRPATPRDVVASAELFPDLLPDHWRDGNNRRSFSAIDEDGRILGHCRGIDNDFHPDSRVLVLEVSERGQELGADDALLAAQLDVSTKPLEMKLTEADQARLGLAARHGAVAIQAMPPWRYVVSPELRAWARARHFPAAGGRIGHIRPADAEDALELFVEHYIAQHARWSPAASAEVLRIEFTEGFLTGPEAAFDSAHGVALRRDGRIVAQALLDPPEDEDRLLAGDFPDEREVHLNALPYEGPTSRVDKEACLAALVGSLADGDVLLIDSHLTEREESAMMESLPGPDPHPENAWMAIIAIPVPGLPRPRALDPALVPEAARWLHAFTASDG